MCRSGHPRTMSFTLNYPAKQAKISWKCLRGLVNSYSLNVIILCEWIVSLPHGLQPLFTFTKVINTSGDDSHKLQHMCGSWTWHNEKMCGSWTQHNSMSNGIIITKALKFPCSKGEVLLKNCFAVCFHLELKDYHKHTIFPLLYDFYCSRFTKSSKQIKSWPVVFTTLITPALRVSELFPFLHFQKFLSYVVHPYRSVHVGYAWQGHCCDNLGWQI